MLSIKQYLRLRFLAFTLLCVFLQVEVSSAESVRLCARNRRRYGSIAVRRKSRLERRGKNYYNDVFGSEGETLISRKIYSTDWARKSDSSNDNFNELNSCNDWECIDKHFLEGQEIIRKLGKSGISKLLEKKDNSKPDDMVKLGRYRAAVYVAKYCGGRYGTRESIRLYIHISSATVEIPILMHLLQ